MARYTSGLYPLAEMGPLLRRQGAQVGLDRAEVWVAITDGGAGLEDFVRLNFPRVEAVILDFYHAAEYLAKLLRRCTRPTRSRRLHRRSRGRVCYGMKAVTR